MDENENECFDKDGTTISGYLTRPVKNGKSTAFRRKRFYKLDGAVLSKHTHKGSPATTALNVQGAEIREIGRFMFALSLKGTENATCHDFGKNMLVLSARTEKECGVWVSALKAATQRKLKQYYEVGKVIGQGGFALVRIGRCLKSKELRAIKTLRKDDSYAKLQGREIAIIKSTDHPNIVKTYDVFESKTEIHIVMEFMAGGMLYDAIEDGIRFTEDDVVQFTREILDGILYLHGKGIVHRDLKPENILCTSRTAPLHVKISDFGLSCITNVADLKANRVLMSTMIGTPEFIAPEIARQEQYTEKVDMWALGMLCYNVIAGTLPIDESKDLHPQIRDGVKLTFPERVWTSYSPEARSFLRALLCTEPQKRLSPLGCMVHPWLEKQGREKSTNVGTHGRISHRISTMNLATTNDRNANNLLGSSRTKTTAPRSNALSGRKGWKTAYLAVAAVNRFKWLANPREPSDMGQLDIEDSLAIEEDEDDLGSDSDESTSSSLGSAKFATFLKSIQMPGGHKDGQKRQSSPVVKGKKGIRLRPSQDAGLKAPSVSEKGETGSSGSGNSASGIQVRRHGVKSGTAREGNVGVKKAGRVKDRAEMSAGMSPLRKVSRKLTTVADNAGILGSLRKISRKLTSGSAKPKGEVVEDEDLEESLAALGVTEVDEGDLLLLEDGEYSGHGAAEGRLSENRVSCPSGGAAAEMSPVTPSSQRIVREEGKGKMRGCRMKESSHT